MLTDLTEQQKLKLKHLMIAFIQFIFYLRRDEHISSFYERLRCLTADDRREFLTCSLIYTIIHTGSLPFLACYFQSSFCSLSHLCSTFSSADLVIPSCQLSRFQLSFICTSCTWWNFLPPRLKETNSVKQFRGLLFGHLRRREKGDGPTSTSITTHLKASARMLQSTRHLHLLSFYQHRYELHILFRFLF